ncbi:MAG: hypothetical protein ACREJM_12715, partial [Candidatus Saccharimonadales bacterium]
GDHPRTREAVTLLLDRLLPQGGCNYGNTSVFGRVLRPHLEPSGLTLAALAGESDNSQRVAKTRDYLRRSLSENVGGVSLAYGLLGLTAHGRRPPEANHWISEATRSVKSPLAPRNDGRSRSERRPYRTNFPLRQAMLAMAACEHCPLTDSFV